MRKSVRRLSVASTAALASTAFVTVVTPPLSFADCDNTQWWDPVGNICRPLVAPDCGNGSWWDPGANACRPLVTEPLACDFGSYWDPVANVCRVVFVPPPE
ncbi:MAG: hypothetical protein WAM92_16335 [Mycobacterium sp.]